MARCYPGSHKLFPSAKEMDVYLIDAINCKVKPEDELHILGDFSAEPTRYRQRIKCKHVYLTRGNHDPVQKSQNVFGPNIPFQREVKLRGTDGHLHCILSHSPQAFWFGSHKGWAHLYGHTHGQREVTLDQWLGKERRSMDVGVDNIRMLTGNYFPFDEQELYAILIGRSGHDHPAFYLGYQAERDHKYGFK